uniref:Uncharacterized protein n=1 Tax=Arundo donax TaxID=35708 RepID=A0A0A9BYE5_ARUDO
MLICFSTMAKYSGEAPSSGIRANSGSSVSSRTTISSFPARIASCKAVSPLMFCFRSIAFTFSPPSCSRFAKSTR